MLIVGCLAAVSEPGVPGSAGLLSTIRQRQRGAFACTAGAEFGLWADRAAAGFQQHQPEVHTHHEALHSSPSCPRLLLF